MGLKGVVAVAMLWPGLANGYGQKDSKEDAVKNFQVEKALVLRLYHSGRSCTRREGRLTWRTTIATVSNTLRQPSGTTSTTHKFW